MWAHGQARCLTWISAATPLRSCARFRGADGRTAGQKPENRGGFERTSDAVFGNDGKTMYVVDYGELCVDFTMPTPPF
jgi:hypothetical protein